MIKNTWLCLEYQWICFLLVLDSLLMQAVIIHHVMYVISSTESTCNACGMLITFSLCECCLIACDFDC